MKFIKTKSGISVPVSNEENTLITKVMESKELNRDNMVLREQQLAENLVKRGVLNKAGKIYSFDRADFWRK